MPQKIDTFILERGTSLSGGQKQRIMLARALALNPKILFLDDFTARVDNLTEKKILANIEKNYPVARKINHNGFIIGCHQDLKKNDLDYIVETFNRFLERFIRN